MPFFYRWKHGGINLSYLLLGTITFLIAPAFEFISIKGIRGGKQILGLTSLALLGYAVRGACLYPEKFSLPAGVAAFAWLLLAASTVLLRYSLCIGIPFVHTYHSSGVGKHLVTTGTYTLVRHPGVFWFASLMAALALISRSRLSLVAALVWTAPTYYTTGSRIATSFPSCSRNMRIINERYRCLFRPGRALGVAFAR